MALIVCDIDSTLYDFAAAAREAFFDLGIRKDDREYFKGAYAPLHEWRSLTDAAGLDRALEAIDYVHKNQYGFDPYHYANAVMWRISEEHDFKYVTSRDSKYHSDTVDWLAINDFPDYENVVCCGHDKSEYLTDAQYLIDDRPKTVVDFIYDREWKGEQRLAFGIWHPHNQALTDIRNVLLAPHWFGLEWYLERKGVIS